MMEYIDTAGKKKLISALLEDPAVTKKDLRIAFYLSGKDAQRSDLLKRFFASEDDPSGSGNRANLTRVLNRLKPYLEVTSAEGTGTWYRLKSGL